jgi:hypothetical protein
VLQATRSVTDLPWTNALPFTRPGIDISLGTVVGGPAGSLPGPRPGTGGSGSPMPAPGGGPGRPGGGLVRASACRAGRPITTTAQISAMLTA